jgi:hypothetical protein
MHGIVKTDLKPPSLDQKTLAKFILSASKGLVETTTAGWNTRVQFIHESLRSYFLGEGVVHLIDNTVVDRVRSDSIPIGVQGSVAMTAYCHDQLKERCLDYIVQVITVIEPLWLGPTAEPVGPNSELVQLESKSEQYGRIWTAYPFIYYAVKGVMEHATTALDIGLTQHAFMEVLPCNELKIFQDLVKKDFDTLREPTNTELWYKAYTAARFGCPKLLRAVLEAQTPFEASQWQWNAILCASIEASDFECVSTALQAGADPNAPSPTKRGRHCFGYAVRRAVMVRYGIFATVSRCRSIIELLLEHGARPYATSEETEDCLYYACCNDGLEIARILLGEHLKADTQCSQYGMSLARAVGRASCYGLDKILRFLLDKGAETGWWSRETHNTDREDSFEVTFGDISIVRLILAKDPQVIASSGTPTELKLRFKLTPEYWWEI